MTYHGVRVLIVQTQTTNLNLLDDDVEEGKKLKCFERMNKRFIE